MESVILTILGVTFAFCRITGDWSYDDEDTDSDQAEQTEDQE